MENIKVARTSNVILHKNGKAAIGTLHLTAHHIIFSSEELTSEIWVPCPMVNTVFKNTGSTLLSRYADLDELQTTELPQADTPAKLAQLKKKLQWYQDNDMWTVTNIKIICKDYSVLSVDFPLASIANDVYDSLFSLTVLSSVKQLYAFLYTPNETEKKLDGLSWELYDANHEWKRQGLDMDDPDCHWRQTDVNSSYAIAETYPRKLFVPRRISDTLISHCSKYRSKGRFPVLAYYYKKHNCTITRSSQPLPGITKQRSVQDEKLMEIIFSSSNKTGHNLIVDARPLTNAVAQVALGGGTELMDNYGFNNTAKRMFLGIDNIHVMSETMNSFIDNYLTDADIFPQLSFSGKLNCKFHNWEKYIKLILSSVDQLSKAMIFNGSNVLVHCSDGWDRTAQVISLVEICIDPFFRTFDGFMVLVEKDWVTFGHKFRERSHHLSSTDCFHDNTTGIFNDNPFSRLRRKSVSGDSSTGNMGRTAGSARPAGVSSSSKFASPVFQQFLDCVYQLQRQNPNAFEFNARFLKRLVYQLYSCQYGTFLFNNEKEMVDNEAKTKTSSVWDHFRSRKDLYINKQYSPRDSTGSETEGSSETDPAIDYLSPDLSNVVWWASLYGRKESEMSYKNLERVISPTKKVSNNGSSLTQEESSTAGLVESTKELFSYFGLDRFKGRDNTTT